MNSKQIKKIKKKINQIKITILDMIYTSGSGHIGSSFSSLELMYLVMTNYINYKKKNRNIFILSKGHSVPAFYAILYHLNILSLEELKTFRKFGSKLQGHPDMTKLEYLDSGTGALGQGLSISTGYSLSAKLKKKKKLIFCLLGDGEIQEGQIWEAAMYIGAKKINNILTIIDGNKFQNEYSIKETLPVNNIVEKFHSFGFKTYSIDGHSIIEINKVLKFFSLQKTSKPILLYLKTTKGNGVSFMENNNYYHSVKNLSLNEYNKAVKELKEIN